MADDPTPDQPGGVIVIRSLDPAFYFLVLLDGRLGFRGTTRIEKEDDAKLPPVPTDDRMARMSTTFLRNRDTIQIEVTKGELQRSKVQADKHHWYLTGKYTEGRAEVTLTKEPTKYSHWQFVPVEGELGTRQFYIRNINDLGKDAWLAVAPGMGTLYQGGIELRNAELAFGRKQAMRIRARRSAAPPQ